MGPDDAGIVVPEACVGLKPEFWHEGAWCRGSSLSANVGHFHYVDIVRDAVNSSLLKGVEKIQVRTDLSFETATSIAGVSDAALAVEVLRNFRISLKQQRWDRF